MVIFHLWEGVIFTDLIFNNVVVLKELIFNREVWWSLGGVWWF